MTGSERQTSIALVPASLLVLCASVLLRTEVQRRWSARRAAAGEAQLAETERGNRSAALCEQRLADSRRVPAASVDAVERSLQAAAAAAQDAVAARAAVRQAQRDIVAATAERDRPLWSWVVLAATAGVGLSPAAHLALVARDRRRWRAGRCLVCGYSLTDNASGVCPECGTPVPGRKMPA